MDRPPVKCPSCGQLNAGDNAVCVVCRAPLRAAAVSAASAQPVLAQRTAAKMRQYGEIIMMYIRWTGYARWLIGIVPLVLGSIIFAASMVTGDFWGIAIAGPVAIGGLIVIRQAPRVRDGLIRGETWSYNVILRMHLAIYVVLGLMMIGLLALTAAGPTNEGQRPWVAVLCLDLILAVPMIINWYAHQAFSWAIGRRDRVRRFIPLSESGGRTTGVKAYTYLMLFYSGIFILLIAAAVRSKIKGNPDSELVNPSVISVSVALLVLMLSLAYGVWMRRRWARLLAMGVHGLVGLSLLLVMIGLIPSSGGAGIIPGLGQFFINMAVFNWFRFHSDYFDR
jgi:hypothetical protein